MERRLKLGYVVLCLGVFVAFFVNNLLSHINFTLSSWQPLYLFPSYDPVGIDFRWGLYDPVKALIEGKSPYAFVSSNYSPFTYVLAMPFQLLNEDAAYIVQVLLLYVANIACIWIALDVARSIFAPNDNINHTLARRLVAPIFLVTSFLLIISYGFQFSVERGNYDIFAMFMSILGIKLIIRRPDQIWLQVICLSVASHLKLYPGILFALVIWRHGKRSLVPLLVVNLAMLLSTGPVYARQYFDVMIRYIQAPVIWIGNQSAASFSQMVNEYLRNHAVGTVPPFLFYVAPIGLWAFGSIVLWKRGYSNIGVMWMFVLSVPLMNLIPSTSHDYKLVLLAAPSAIALYALLITFTSAGDSVRFWQVTAIIAITVILSRSYTLLPPVLGNKYPFILILQAVFLWAAMLPSNTPQDSIAVLK